MPSAMELNLLGGPEIEKDAKLLPSEVTARSFFRERCSITHYVDERGEGEAKGHIREMLSAALQGNNNWSLKSIEEDLNLGLEVTGRFSDTEIAKLGKEEFWQSTTYSVLLRIAKMDVSVQQRVDNFLSLQRFDPANKLLWAISILQGIISGAAPFTLDCLGHPASAAILEGRIRKMMLGIVELEAPDLKKPKIVDSLVSMKEFLSTKGVPMVDIDELKSELACGDFSQLSKRSFQTLGEVTANEIAVQPLDRMTLALAIEITVTTGITLTQGDCKKILALNLTESLLLKISGVVKSQRIEFSNVFKATRTLEAANKIAGMKIYPGATQMLSEIEAQVSATADITKNEANWAAICDHIVWPHLIRSTQERLRDLRSGIKELGSMCQLPAALQMRFGPLMAMPRLEKDSAVHKRPGICFYFQQHGSCSRGDNCRFVHEKSAKKSKAAETAPTVACFDYKNGKCKFGSNCKYSHD